ncbi:hypothetical protein SRRS_19190 [Sporomusa rhizae]|uniref:hypothetical protein n=1 Tax=Sporomusa rhizae TaxID=357999 RepID=UPI00352B2375
MISVCRYVDFHLVGILISNHRSGDDFETGILIVVEFIVIIVLEMVMGVAVHFVVVMSLSHSDSRDLIFADYR